MWEIYRTGVCYLGSMPYDMPLDITCNDGSVIYNINAGCVNFIHVLKFRKHIRRKFIFED